MIVEFIGGPRCGEVRDMLPCREFIVPMAPAINWMMEPDITECPQICEGVYVLVTPLFESPTVLCVMRWAGER